MEELKHQAAQGEGHDDDSDDEFFDAESDEEVEEELKAEVPTHDECPEALNSSVDMGDGVECDGAEGIDSADGGGATGDEILSPGGALDEDDLGDSDPNDPDAQRRRRGTVRQRVKKAAGKAGAATLWATATAARKTAKAAKVAAYATGHAAVVARKKAAKAVVRKKRDRSRPERADSIRRMNVYKESTSAPYAWQQFEGTTNYEMALHARKMQLESDWMAEKKKSDPQTVITERPNSLIVDEPPPDVGELTVGSADELEDWLNEESTVPELNNGNELAPHEPEANEADDECDEPRPSILMSEEPLVGPSGEDEEHAVEVEDSSTVSPSDGSSSADGADGAEPLVVSEVSSGADSTPSPDNEVRIASTHADDEAEDTLITPTVTVGVDLDEGTSTDIVFDDSQVMADESELEGYAIVFTSEELQEEYSMILAELDRITKTKMLMDNRDDADMAVGDASSTPDFGMLFAMENLEALSSSDPAVVAQARFDVLQKHVTALRQLYVGCEEDELGEVRDVLKSLSKDIGKEVKADGSVTPPQPKGRREKKRAARAPRSPASSKRLTSPATRHSVDALADGASTDTSISSERAPDQPAQRSPSPPRNTLSPATQVSAETTPESGTAKKGYLSRVKQVAVKGAKVVSGAAAKVGGSTGKRPPQQTSSTSSL